jgi:hypothetical protein
LPSWTMPMAMLMTTTPRMRPMSAHICNPPVTAAATSSMMMRMLLIWRLQSVVGGKRALEAVKGQ